MKPNANIIETPIDYCYAIPYHICYKESLDYKGVVKYDKYINAKDIN